MQIFEYVWTISLIQANIVMSNKYEFHGMHKSKNAKIGTQHLEWKEYRYITSQNQENHKGRN